MSYTKTNWTESTAINVDRLMNIENGIEGSYTELTSIQNEIDNLEVVVSKKPNAFQGSYLSASDANDSSLRTSFEMQDGDKPDPKIYTDIFDVSFPELSTGSFHDFSISIKNKTVVAIQSFAGAFINSFSRELNVNVVDWTSTGGEINTIVLRAQNVSSSTLSARSRRFNIMVTGY